MLQDNHAQKSVDMFEGHSGKDDGRARRTVAVKLLLLFEL